MGRYEAELESAPLLQDRLRAFSKEGLDLRGEVALLRALLGEVLALLGRAHAQSGGKLSPGALELVMSLTREVSATVDKAAAIEAKRDDQRLDAAQLVLLMQALRGDLEKRLADAGMGAAVPLIASAFDAAKWTGLVAPGKAQELVDAPEKYEVTFRLIEREGEKPVALNHEVASAG